MSSVRAYTGHTGKAPGQGKARQVRTMATKQELREFAATARAMEKAGPSAAARAIVASRKESETREALESAARGMGVTANELAAEILMERERQAESQKKESKEFEVGFLEVESKERRSVAKAMIAAEHATRPDYHIARELLDAIGKDSGVVLSSAPNGDITISAVKRAVNAEHATALQERAIAGVEKVAARIESAERAIEKAPLKKGTPAMQKELADAERAMVIARQRLVKANVRMEHAKAISADGIRLEYVTTITADDVFKFDVTGTRIADSTIESWELPNQIIRRPFREYVRPRIRRNPISPVECEILRIEAKAERVELEKRIHAEVNSIIAEKAAKELDEAESERAILNAAYKSREAERKRNARKAKRNAR